MDGPADVADDHNGAMTDADAMLELSRELGRAATWWEVAGIRIETDPDGFGFGEAAARLVGTLEAVGTSAAAERRASAIALAIQHILAARSDWPDTPLGQLVARASGAHSVGPTIATVAAQSTDEDLHWLAARAFAQFVDRHPEHAVEAIREAPSPTGSAAVDSLLAAIAETIADDAGLPAPAWCAIVPAADEPWEHAGTPMMKERSRRSAPPRFAARGIWLSRNSIWHWPGDAATGRTSS